MIEGKTKIVVPLWKGANIGISTEAAWAKVLGLGDDYFEALLDTEKVLAIAGGLQ